MEDRRKKPKCQKPNYKALKNCHGEGGAKNKGRARIAQFVKGCEERRPRCARLEGRAQFFWFGWICPRGSWKVHEWGAGRGMQEVFKKRRPTLKQQHVLTSLHNHQSEQTCPAVCLSSRERTNECERSGQCFFPASAPSLHQISILAL